MNVIVQMAVLVVVENVNVNVVNMRLNLKYDGKSYNAIVGLLMALGGWTLTRTFDLSTNLVVSQEKVNKLERQVEKLEDQNKYLAEDSGEWKI